MLVYRTVLKESELHCPKPTKIHSETRGFGSKSKKRGHIASIIIIMIVIMIMMSVPRRQCVSGSCNIHEIVLNEVSNSGEHFVSDVILYHTVLRSNFSDDVITKKKYKHQLKVARRLTERLEASFQMPFYLLCIIQSLFNTVHKVV